MSLLVSKPLEELLEHEWKDQIIGSIRTPGIARQLGFRVYHTLRSKGSQPGFPDWVLVRERVIYLELKREIRSSKLTEPQKEWVLALLHAGAEVYVARPSDLQALAELLACRGDPFLKRETVDTAARLRDKTREEAS